MMHIEKIILKIQIGSSIFQMISYLTLNKLANNLRETNLFHLTVLFRAKQWKA